MRDAERTRTLMASDATTTTASTSSATHTTHCSRQKFRTFNARSRFAAFICVNDVVEKAQGAISIGANCETTTHWHWQDASAR
jgi:hypothetical protein